MAFFPLWLNGRGLDAVDIGLILSLPQWIRIASNPVAGFLADRFGDAATVMRCASVAACLAAACYVLADGFWAIAAVTLVFSAIHGPIMPLCDGLTVTLSQMRRLDYGRVRLWGSVGFIGATLGAGLVLAGRSAEPAVYLMIGAAIATASLSAILPRVLIPLSAATRLRHPFVPLGDRRFVLMLIAAGLIQSSHAALYGFGSLHWRSLGFDNNAVGLFWAVGVFAEVILFVYARHTVERIGPANLLILGCLVGVLRWAATPYVESATGIGVLQALHAVTYGASHLGAMFFMARAVPATVSGTAQTLYAAIANSALMALTMVAIGPIYAALGTLVFWPMTAMAALGAAVALALRRRWPEGRGAAT
jgi:PPP family 3-phenylpropionic acid transporter